MLTKQRLSGLVCAGVIGLAAVACSSGGEDAEAPPVTFDESMDDGATTDETATDETEPTDADPTDDDPDGTDDGDPAPAGVITMDDPQLSDGVWAVGDAGTVEFAIGDGGLELIEALPNDGWQMSIDEDSPDEIEVDFERGELEYEIEIELEGGILEIEIDLDIAPADPGTFELGPAGTAELAVEGGSVVLVDLTPADGWDITEQDTDDGEVEIELRQGNIQWELDAEIDDGRLEVEIDFEIEGALS